MKYIVGKIQETKMKNGTVNSKTFLGKKHTNATKKKMSLSKKGQGVGKDNSQFGTRWITNGVLNKKINKIESIPNGFRYGRKLK